MDGVISERLFVFFVMALKRAATTFSLGATLVVEFGLKSWLILPFSMCFRLREYRRLEFEGATG